MAGCTEDTVVIPNRMQIAYVSENQYALLECIPGYEFPSSSDGIYWCDDNEWIGTIPECICKLLEKTRVLLVIQLIHCSRGVTFGLFPIQYIVFYIGFVVGISGVD